MNAAFMTPQDADGDMEAAVVDMLVEDVRSALKRGWR
jgi:hypothetical protein